jgi:sugar lactone lactonase YvrE
MKKFIMFLFSISISAQNVTTFAGSCNEVDHGLVNGIGTVARFYNPSAITVDVDGNFYIADSNNNCIRKITPNGLVSTLAACPTNFPVSVAVDSQKNVYFSAANYIYKINAGSNVASVFAGGNIAGNIDGIGTNSQFNHPVGLAIDMNDNIYVADKFNHRIRKITNLGVVTTFAGGAPGNVNGNLITAQFNSLEGIIIDSFGNFFIADTNNNQIKKISTDGQVTTYIGNGTQDYVDGIGLAVSLNQPINLTIDSNNNIYFVSKNSNTIRCITPSMNVTTIVGDRYDGWGYCQNGLGINAHFSHPTGLISNQTGNIYVADNVTNTIRKITGLLTTNNINFDSSIIISPNPTTTSFYIGFENFSACNLSIFDMNGRILQKKIVSEKNTSVDISNLTKGVYLIEIISDQGTAFKKIIKE